MLIESQLCMSRRKVCSLGRYIKSKSYVLGRDHTVLNPLQFADHISLTPGPYLALIHLNKMIAVRLLYFSI